MLLEGFSCLLIDKGGPSALWVALFPRQVVLTSTRKLVESACLSLPANHKAEFSIDPAVQLLWRRCPSTGLPEGSYLEFTPWYPSVMACDLEGETRQTPNCFWPDYLAEQQKRSWVNLSVGLGVPPPAFLKISQKAQSHQRYYSVSSFL